MNKFNTMNIHAPKGTKVYYMDCNGYDLELVRCRSLGLKKGDCLTVSHTIVHDFSTDVFFEERESSFNSVHFTEENFMATRTVQFNHNRKIKNEPNIGSHIGSLFAAKGGRTIALEVPSIEEFKKLQDADSFATKLGIAECSKKDNYNKKLGRKIALGRFEENHFKVSVISDTEKHLVHRLMNLTLILRKHPNTEKVYFEEIK